MYCQIQEKLSSLPLYQPVFVNDYSPSDRYVCKHWLNNLQLEFPVKMYRYSHGNSLGSMTFLWRLPSDSSEDSTSTAKAITCLNSKQKLYHTRQMRRDFLIQYSEFVKAPTCVLRHMFKELVRDSSAAVPTIEQKVDERVAEAIIELQDPEIIMDLRKNNGKVQSSFEDFWSELQKYLDEITSVNERRHGDTMYLPIAISVRDLREIVSERLTKAFPGEEKPIPSDEWIRLQFWPRNPYTTTSLRYTGRFEMKYAVQARQMRKTHPDCRCVAVILQYMKRFTVSFIEHTLLLSVDDKAIVPVGEPGYPISTGVRGHNRSLVSSSPDAPLLAALDHDFHLFGIVPSVALAIDIPESPNDSFFTGQPNVVNKNKITQPSSPYRHSAELVQLIHAINISGDDQTSSCKPILVIMSDGGPDHRVSFGSVQVSMVALFSKLDLDMLIRSACKCVHTKVGLTQQNVSCPL